MCIRDSAEPERWYNGIMKMDFNAAQDLSLIHILPASWFWAYDAMNTPSQTSASTMPCLLYTSRCV